MADLCGFCGTKIAFSNPRLSAQGIDSFNKYYASEHSDLCRSCSKDSIEEARKEIYKETVTLRAAVTSNLQLVPVLSIHSPADWKYDAVTIVTAQTVTGTGIFSDVASTFTDIFGAQSGSYVGKIKGGEALCKQALRIEAIERDCNAILAVDIDYAEVGGSKAMIMVCMTGTAVKLGDDGTLSDGTFHAIEELRTSYRRIKFLQSLDFDRLA